MPLRYPFVLFDVGETLVGPRRSFGAAYADVLVTLGIDIAAERLEQSLRQVVLEIGREIPPGRDRYGYYPGGEAEYWSRFCRRTLHKALGHEPDERLNRRALERLRQAFRTRAAWLVYPDVVPALTRLQAEGVRLAVVSNWDSRLPHVLELLELAPYFDYVGVSHLAGIEKPDPALFRLVLAQLGARPEQALHVGDVPELDQAGARAAGLDAVLVDRLGRLDASFSALADLDSLPTIAREGLAGPAGCDR